MTSAMTRNHNNCEAFYGFSAFTLSGSWPAKNWAGKSHQTLAGWRTYSLNQGFLSVVACHAPPYLNHCEPFPIINPNQPNWDPFNLLIVGSSQGICINMLVIKFPNKSGDTVCAAFLSQLWKVAFLRLRTCQIVIYLPSENRQNPTYKKQRSPITHLVSLAFNFTTTEASPSSTIRNHDSTLVNHITNHRTGRPQLFTSNKWPVSGQAVGMFISALLGIDGGSPQV